MGPWYTLDPAAQARADNGIRLLEARRELESMHADIELKFTTPVLSLDDKWEATWREGHVSADSYAEMCQKVREALGIEVPQKGGQE